MAHCSPRVAMLAHHVVYQSYSLPLPCADATQRVPAASSSRGTRTRDTSWRHEAAAVETSPLWSESFSLRLLGRDVLCLDARTGKVSWTFGASASITSSPATTSGRCSWAPTTGTLRARRAHGKAALGDDVVLRFGRREYFYATPTLAYGRCTSERRWNPRCLWGEIGVALLWAQRAGTYVYTAAAAWRQRIYVARGRLLSAFDAATGDLLWRHDAEGGISGAPTVMAGLSTTDVREVHELAPASRKGRAVPNVRARCTTGKPIWQFPDGQYSPSSDRHRVYLVGSEAVYASSRARPVDRREATDRWPHACRQPRCWSGLPARPRDEDLGDGAVARVSVASIRRWQGPAGRRDAAKVCAR